MSCLYRTPRPATVRAERDVYVLEMLRNIYEAVLKDPALKDRSDEDHTKSGSELQLRRLPLFKDLSQEQFDELRGSMQMVSVEPGKVIFEEHERSNALYLIRSGLVKVAKNVSSLLPSNGAADWPALIAALREG